MSTSSLSRYLLSMQTLKTKLCFRTFAHLIKLQLLRFLLLPPLPLSTPPPFCCIPLHSIVRLEVVSLREVLNSLIGRGFHSHLCFRHFQSLSCAWLLLSGVLHRCICEGHSCLVDCELIVLQVGENLLTVIPAVTVIPSRAFANAVSRLRAPSILLMR